MGTFTGADTGTAALDALVTELADAHRAVATAQARESRVLAAAVDLVVARTEEAEARGGRRAADADMPLREISAELAAALRLSDRAVQRRMGNAWSLAERFPATVAAWEGGEIDAGHVAAILDAGTALPEPLQERYEKRVLDVARFESANRLRSLAPAIAAKIDPAGAAERIAARRADRDVWVRDLGEGMARLMADLPAVLAHAIVDRLTAMAQKVQGAAPDDEAGEASDGSGDQAGSDDQAARDHAEGERGSESESGAQHESGCEAEPTVVTGPGGTDGDARRPRGGSATAAESDADADSRYVGQVRADLLADMLLGGAPVAHGAGLEAVAGHVQVTVPALSLIGTSREPALLDGSGPIDIETARRLAGNAPGWDRLLTDPHTGAVLAVERYRANAGLKRFLRARDERCRFPGCVRPARGCDLDHNEDAARGGPTCDHNLCHFCRRHHTLKHVTPWRVRQLPGGIIEWTSPTGRRYRDRPPATVRFVPELEPPPPF